ncbi:hypothetical protein [Effusibacillus consociatus]|uniref:Glycerophosphoryl diester phosphodiesterase membrane domain-containing protein n=1 Tax=Effusibacillus consociatus TaxID=1117041 RepID=A0ABV9Q1U6_9BACL
MKLLLESFRTINRNLGMIWPPVVTAIGLFLLFLISVFLLVAGTGIFLSFENFFSSGFDPGSFDFEAIFDEIGPGFLLILIPFLLLSALLVWVVTAFMSAGSYKLASDVLSGNKTYWGSFFKGGFRYLGWSLVFGIVTFVMTIPIKILNSIVTSFLPEDGAAVVTVTVLYVILMIVIEYLLLLFYPALIDGKEKFGQALGTSFRLAWKAFLLTILPFIGLLILGGIVIFALIGIGYLTHPLVAVILGIPLILYISPLGSVWMTLVYRKLTHREEPVIPETFEEF